MFHELQGAQAVRHPFEVVALSVREVVHGVCVPLVSRAYVRYVHHPVEKGVAEEHVGVCHVNLGPQHQSAWLCLAAVHELEQPQVLFHRPVPVGAVLAGLGGSALLLCNHLGALFVHVCPSLLDEPHGKVPQFLEVVAGVVYVVPLVAKPPYVVFDALYVFRILFRRVGVVEPQVACPPVVPGDAEVDGDGLGVPYVQVAVGLGWEASLYPASVLALCKVVLYFLLYEVQASFLCRLVCGGFCHNNPCSLSFLGAKLRNVCLIRVHISAKMMPNLRNMLYNILNLLPITWIRCNFAPRSYSDKQSFYLRN